MSVCRAKFRDHSASELDFLLAFYPWSQGVNRTFAAQRDSNPCRHLERSGRHVQQLRSNTIGPGQRPTCVQGWGLCPSKSSEWMGNWMDSGSPKSIPSYGPSFGESAAVTLLGLRADFVDRKTQRGVSRETLRLHPGQDGHVDVDVVVHLDPRFSRHRPKYSPHVLNYAALECQGKPRYSVSSSGRSKPSPRKLPVASSASPPAEACACIVAEATRPGLFAHPASHHDRFDPEPLELAGE